MEDNKFEDGEWIRLMKRLGYVRAEIDYSGGGDDGGANEIRVYKKRSRKGTVLEPKFDHSKVQRYDRDLGDWVILPDAPPEVALYLELCRFPSIEHGSFADGGGYSVSGTIYADPATGLIRFEINETTTEYVENDDDEDDDGNYEEHETTSTRDEEYQTPIDPIYEVALAADENANQRSNRG